MRVRRRFIGICLGLAAVALSGPVSQSLFGPGPSGFGPSGFGPSGFGPSGFGIVGAAWASGGSGEGSDDGGDDNGGSGSSGSGSSGSGSSGSGSSGSGSSGSGSSGSGGAGAGSGGGPSGRGGAVETGDGDSGRGGSDDVFDADGIVVAYADGRSDILRGRRLIRFDRAGRLIEERSASAADRDRMRGIAAQVSALGDSGVSSVMTIDASAGEIRVRDALGWIEFLSRDAYLLADPDGNTVARRKPRQRDLQRIRSMLGD